MDEETHNLTLVTIASIEKSLIVPILHVGDKQAPRLPTHPDTDMQFIMHD